jgi:hypothetical protein
VLFYFYSELFCFAPKLFSPCFAYAAHPLGCNQLGTPSSLQAKVQEFWSPAPLPEEVAGKDAAASANLKVPEVADL